MKFIFFLINIILATHLEKKIYKGRVNIKIYDYAMNGENYKLLLVLIVYYRPRN